jgi:hypothetical protein
MPDLQISVNADPAEDGSPLIAIIMAEAHLIEEDEGVLLPGMTITPENARRLAQALLDIADEAEMRC